MKIIDCFIFYNEIDLLNYRLTLLGPYVDYFVLVEANQTFMGNEKILYYKEKCPECPVNKIINITIDLPYKANQIKNNNQWLNETFQRNAIKLGLSQLNCQPNDIIIISDLDEIIDPNVLKNIRENKLKIQSGYSLEQDFYYYNLTTKHIDKWYNSKIIKYLELKNKSPQEIRFTDYPILKKGGWHLSYFGDSKFISNKIKQFSHNEFNEYKYTNEDQIENLVKNKKDIFHRRNIKLFNIKIEDNPYLPPNYLC